MRCAVKIYIRENTFRLLPQKAILWEEENILLISDLHIGKVQHFRKAGIALPPKAIMENFNRLDELMQETKPSLVLFTGDLFHSHRNAEWETFCEWRKRHEHLPMELVLGNHDRFIKNDCEGIGLTMHENEYIKGPFTFAHHPKNTFEKNEYVICGHIHPVITLTGKARQQLSIPCFYFGAQQAILPSFGYFTGGLAIEPQEGDEVVAIVEGKLVKI